MIIKYVPNRGQNIKIRENSNQETQFNLLIIQNL